MPYIDPDSREAINRADPEGFDDMINIDQIASPGDMQYAIALMIKNYVEYKGLNYQTCNDVMGALAGAQM